MRRSAIVIVVLLAVAAVQIAYYYSQLPNTIASHFNGAGVPNAWQPKQLFFALYAFVLLLSACLYLFLPRAVVTMPPELVNLPNKAYWLAPEHRAETADFLIDHFARFGAATLALVIAVFQLAITANLPGAQPTLPPAIWGFLIAYLGFAVIWLIMLFAKFKRA